MLRRDVEARQSFLLLGPRQVGKTTLLAELVGDRPGVLGINLLRARDRDLYSVDPDRLIDEVGAALKTTRQRPLIVVVDELQRVPRLADAVQLILDEHGRNVVAALSGSSARKLRRGQVNLLPGRVVRRFLYPLHA
ncbi:MAG: AAA family ATPase, partial [Deltaproteobacteria bacterium]|nr:AAA family ATPase [Deltaproteobacteria bacterium]